MTARALILRHGMSLLILILLTACSSPPKAHNTYYTQAADAARQAQSAYRHGEYRQAIKYYSMSLQLNRLIENVDGIAINLINLAKVHQVIDQSTASDRYLDLLLNDQVLSFRPEHLCAGSIQKAVLRLHEKNASQAEEWISKAGGYCADDSPLRGVIANVRASVALSRQDYDVALYWGNKGLAENTKETLEYANSLRLLAQAHMLAKNHVAALPLLNSALQLDKELGLPNKIRHDLSLISEVYVQMRNADLAKQYQIRASRIVVIK